MGIYECGVRVVLRGMMRVAEARIAHAGLLGTPAPGVGQGRNVLLVHGYGNDSSSFTAVRDSLRRDGFGVQTIDLPNFGYGDLMRDAELVGQRARAMSAAAGGAPVDVVGHSRGGVVSRTWKQLLDRHRTPGRVFTISSPNQGVHLGRLDGLVGPLMPEGIKQLRQGSSIIRALHYAPARNVAAIGTRGFDGVQAPARAAKILGAPFYVVDEDRTVGHFSRIGHWEILRDDVSYEIIRGALLAQPPSHPKPRPPVRSPWFEGLAAPVLAAPVSLLNSSSACDERSFPSQTPN